MKSSALLILSHSSPLRWGPLEGGDQIKPPSMLFGLEDGHHLIDLLSSTGLPLKQQACITRLEVSRDLVSQKARCWRLPVGLMGHCLVDIEGNDVKDCACPEENPAHRIARVCAHPVVDELRLGPLMAFHVVYCVNAQIGGRL